MSAAAQGVLSAAERLLQDLGEDEGSKGGAELEELGAPTCTLDVTWAKAARPQHTSRLEGLMPSFPLNACCIQLPSPHPLPLLLIHADGGIQSSPDHPVLFEFKLGGDAASPFEGREGEACDKFSAALSTGIRELLGGIAVSGPIPVECAAGQDEGSLEIYLRAAAVVPAEVQAKLESLVSCARGPCFSP